MKFEKLKQKLSSRKFWSALVGFAVSLAAVFGANEMTTGQITGLITATGVLIAYIFGESYVDGNRDAGTEEDSNR